MQTYIFKSGSIVYIDARGLADFERLHQAIQNNHTIIMGLISEFAASQNAFNDAQSSAIDEIVNSSGALTADIAELNRMIKELQDRPGEDTPENRQLLDAILARSEAQVTKSKGVAAALKTLDEQTPPAVPTEPPTEPPTPEERSRSKR